MVEGRSTDRVEWTEATTGRRGDRERGSFTSRPASARLPESGLRDAAARLSTATATAASTRLGRPDGRTRWRAVAGGGRRKHRECDGKRETVDRRRIEANRSRETTGDWRAKENGRRTTGRIQISESAAIGDWPATMTSTRARTGTSTTDTGTGTGTEQPHPSRDRDRDRNRTPVATQQIGDLHPDFRFTTEYSRAAPSSEHAA